MDYYRAKQKYLLYKYYGLETPFEAKEPMDTKTYN